MTTAKESSSIQARAKHRTTGAFRCLSCFNRLSPPKGASLHTCPKCGYEWRVAWFTPDEPRIRGPVWESYEKLNQANLMKKGEK